MRQHWYPSLGMKTIQGSPGGWAKYQFFSFSVTALLSSTLHTWRKKKELSMKYCSDDVVCSWVYQKILIFYTYFEGMDDINGTYLGIFVVKQRLSSKSRTLIWWWALGLRYSSIANLPRSTRAWNNDFGQGRREASSEKKKNGNFQVSQMILRIYYRLFCTRVTQSAICVWLNCIFPLFQNILFLVPIPSNITSLIAILLFL